MSRARKGLVVVFAVCLFPCLNAGVPVVDGTRTSSSFTVSEEEASAIAPARDLSAVLAITPGVTTGTDNLTQFNRDGSAVILQPNSSFSSISTAPSASPLSYRAALTEAGSLHVAQISVAGDWEEFYTAPGGANFADADLATSADGLTCAIGIHQLEQELRVYCGTNSLYNQVDLNLSASYLSRSTGGIRPRIVANDELGLFSIFATTKDWKLQAIDLKYSDFSHTVTDLGNITSAPGYEAEYGRASGVVNLGTRSSYLLPGEDHLVSYLYDPAGKTFAKETFLFPSTAGTSFSAGPLGMNRAAVSWGSRLYGLEYGDVGADNPIRLFGRFDTDFNDILGFDVDQKLGKGWILGNAGGEFKAADLNLGNLRFAAQSVPGATDYLLSSFERTPMEVGVALYSPEGVLMEEKTIQVDPMETKEVSSDLDEIVPATTRFTGLGSYSVSGFWSLDGPEVTVLPGRYSKTWRTPIQQSNQVRQGLAIQNASSKLNHCQLNLYEGMGGALLESSGLDLGGFEQKSRFADEFFAGHISLGQPFLGSASISCEYGISMMSVRQNVDTAAITNAPADPVELDTWSLPLRIGY
ncbi:MAG: hypothetical protein WAO20_22430 [Acidobacteriota bacterium]